MTKSTRQRLILVSVLTVPAFIFVVLVSGDEIFDGLPILGTHKPVTKVVDGKEVVDTIYHTLPDFAYQNQYGVEVDKRSLEGKILISDFFFTSCKTICPKMSAAMVEIQHKFRERDEVVLLSFTVDPDRDSLPVLADYAKNLGAKRGKWHFLHGEAKATFDLATDGFLVYADEADVPGDFVHSKNLILTDMFGRVRGLYDGTAPADIHKLKGDVNALMIERWHHLKETGQLENDG